MTTLMKSLERWRTENNKQNNIEWRNNTRTSDAMQFIQMMSKSWDNLVTIETNKRANSYPVYVDSDDQCITVTIYEENDDPRTKEQENTFFGITFFFGSDEGHFQGVMVSQDQPSDNYYENQIIRQQAYHLEDLKEREEKENKIEFKTIAKE